LGGIPLWVETAAGRGIDGIRSTTAGIPDSIVGAEFPVNAVIEAAAGERRALHMISTSPVLPRH